MPSFVDRRWYRYEALDRTMIHYLSQLSVNKGVDACKDYFAIRALLTAFGFDGNEVINFECVCRSTPDEISFSCCNATTDEQIIYKHIKHREDYFTHEVLYTGNREPPGLGTTVNQIEYRTRKVL